MIGKKKLIFLNMFAFLLFFAVLPAVYAQEEPIQESCFVSFSINETFDQETNATSFSLLEQRNLYGFYSGSVPAYSDEISGGYVLNLLDSSSQSIGKYSLDSSRFILYDNFGADCDPELDPECDLGGVIEADAGVISVIVPYSSDVSKAIVEQEEVQTDLGINPSDIKCERTCKVEGESGEYSQDQSCCLGYSKIQTSEDAFVCSKCGDGICSEYENELGCFEDCSARVICSRGYTKTSYGCVPSSGKVREIVSAIRAGEDKLRLIDLIKVWLRE